MAKLAATRGTVIGPVIPNTTFNLNDTVSTLLSNDFLGTLIAGIQEDSAAGLFLIENGTITVISANSLFTTNAVIPNKYYIFFDGGFLKVTNKVGNSKTLKISLFGLEPRTS